MELAVLFIAAALAQTSTAPASERAQKKQQQRLRKELASGYSRWLDQDVAWIISGDERAAFRKLQNDDEREQFVEQFWLRRDPTPDTLENEFREEHYRRIAYANQHFASGIPGWRTDRGRIYIAWGPPDEREEHPSGGDYQRAPEEGGGATSTFPFEIWRYRHLEGVDSDVRLEFVDRTMTGEFRLTIDPAEKDALSHVPGYQPPQPQTQSDQSNQFRRLETLAKVFAPPPIRFHDLEAVVDSNVTYHTLPLRVQVNYFPLTEASVLTYVTLQLENHDLEFVARDGVQRATVHILGKVSTMSRRAVMPFEASIAAETPGRMLAEFVRRRSIYTTTLPLAPGAYRLDIAAKDAASGATTRYEAALSVPRLDPEKLQLSSLVLTDNLEKLRPRVDGRFDRNERLGIYGKVYNVPPGTQAAIEIAGPAGVISTATEDLSPGAEATIARFLDLKAFAPGSYTLRLKLGAATAAALFTVF
jgi:GWxTD domain-containing protein